MNLTKPTYPQFASMTGCIVASVCLAAIKLDSKAVPPAGPLGAAYPPPTGGWTYIYDGDKDTAGAADSGFTSLDGTWSHDNGSDTWDGSKIGGTLADGQNAPGGAMGITEGGVTFLRLQDPGDPRIANFTDSLSNRKLYFGHDISSDSESDTVLDDGVTLSFRARIPTPKNTQAPLDQLYLSGASGPTAYPDAGDGYLTSDGGKGNFGIKQRSLGIISFSLTVPRDNFDDSDPAGATADFSGLTMNRLNGNAPINGVDFPSAGDFRGVALDPTQWHEFWITIKADSTGTGTHEVAVYLDGSTTATTNLVVTAGDGDDFPSTPYLAMGGSRTAESYALDVDFFAYKVGAEAPTGTTTQKPQFTSIVTSGGKIIITWTGTGTLQSATNLPATWQDMTGITSPATNTIAGPVQFYRVKQ
jgi:hypothetical protein